MNKYLMIGLMFFTLSVLAESSGEFATISKEEYLGTIGKTVDITMRNAQCTVTSTGKYKKITEQPVAFQLHFNCYGKTQVLWDINKPHKLEKNVLGFDEPRFEVIWVGDKDKDGKLDLIMDLSPKYSCSKKVTFLSSLAKKDQLLGVSEYGECEYGC